MLLLSYVRHSISLAGRRRFFFSIRGGASASTEPGATEDLAASREKPPMIHEKFSVSASSIRGFRNYMEDEYDAMSDYVGVFDGHGGPKVSRYLRENLGAELQAARPRMLVSPQTLENITTSETLAIQSNVTIPKVTDPNSTLEHYQLALQDALERIDQQVQKINHWSFQGSTVVAAWFINDKRFLMANIGDSRAVLSQQRKAIALTRDHKPDDPIEVERIHERGGEIVWFGQIDHQGEPVRGTGLYRVNGNLALSRAVGDRSERPCVTADPDIGVFDIDDDSDFIVLGTDGLWDVMSNQDVVSMVHALLDSEECDKDDVAAMLVEESLRRGSFDNITVLIVWLNR